MAQLPTKLAYGAYPIGVDKIPYASWLKINRYSYQEGIAQVAKNQKDALRILSEGNLISGAANAIAGTAQKDIKEKLEKARKRRQDQKAAADAVTTYVGLSLPNEFQYEYGANWNNTFKLGTLALLADNPANAALAAGAGAAILGGATALINKAKVSSAASSVAQAAGQGAAFGIDPFNVASQLNPTNLAYCLTTWYSGLETKSSIIILDFG